MLLRPLLLRLLRLPWLLRWLPPLLLLLPWRLLRLLLLLLRLRLPWLLLPWLRRRVRQLLRSKGLLLWPRLRMRL